MNPTEREQSLQMACRCAAICEDFRGQNTLLLDLRRVTPVVDFFVISTGSSKRQMQAMADEVGRMMKQSGSPRLSKEGYEAGLWILEDFGDIVIHLFTAEARALYDLERLWADAERIDWKAALGR